MSILLNYLNDDEKDTLYIDVLKKERDRKLQQEANKSILQINNPLEVRFIMNELLQYIDPDTSNICLKYIEEEITPSNRMVRVARYSDQYIKSIRPYVIGYIGYLTLEYKFNGSSCMLQKIQTDLCSTFSEYGHHVNVDYYSSEGRLIIRIGHLLDRDKYRIINMTKIQLHRS